VKAPKADPDYRAMLAEQRDTLDGHVFLAIQKGATRAEKINEYVGPRGFADPKRAIKCSLQRLRKIRWIKSDGKANWSVVK